MEANGIENLTNPNQEREFIRRHHKHELVDNQCSSTLVKHINAPVHIVSFSLLLLPSCALIFSV
jgi:abscisic acid receptor (PYR/PYL family)